MTDTCWPQHESTGIERIDRQHHDLVALVDTFCSLPSESRDQVSVRDFLGTLLRQTEAHFRSEEELMAGWHDARLGVHKVAHARLLAQITDVHRRAHLGENLNFDAFAIFLKEWLVNHINQEDSLMGEHIKRSGPERIRSSVDSE